MSGFGGSEGFLFKQEAKSPAFFYPTMTGNAVFVKDGFDIGTEINILFFPEKEKTDQGNPDQNTEKYS
jgi:hypothetical protein